MTKKERNGLDQLILAAPAVIKDNSEVNAAIDWIQRQVRVDERRRRKRGKYRVK